MVMKNLDSTKLSIAAVALAAVLFVAVNMISGAWLSGARLDVTQGGVYSMSDEIKPVFASIEEPIVVRLYFSPALGAASPRHAVYARRVRDLLEQYAKLAPGKLKVEYYNPEPFSDTEDRAIGFGLQSIPMGGVGEVGYFGLAATNSTDDQQVIPFFNLEREQFLEYDLTKLIYSLSKPQQPKVGLISSLPLNGSPGNPQMAMFGMPSQPTPPWAIMQQIREFFTVVPLQSSLTEIPADISILMLAQPEELSPQAQYAIDQFVMRGGKALVFIDPNAEAADPMSGMAGAGSLDGIKKLLATWGVTLVDGKVVGDLNSATRVNTESNGRPLVSDYVAWLQLSEANLAANDAITADIKNINLGTAGILEQVDSAGTTVTPLMVTSRQSMRIDTAKVTGMPDVVALFRDFESADTSELLAARITGTAKSMFPDGPPPSDIPSSEAKFAHLSQSSQPIQVVVVADSDILEDRFWVQQSNFMGQTVLVPTANNDSFVVNALENLTGSPALSSLRGRGGQSRPFTLVEAIRRDSEMQYRATEQALLDRLSELEKQVNSIQLSQGGEAALSEADRRTIDNFRADMLATRGELRDVQRALRENIDRLEGITKFFNIAGVPLFFGLLMVIAASARLRKRRLKSVEV